VNHVRGNQKVVVDQFGRVALVAADPGGAASGDDDALRPVVLEETADGHRVAKFKLADAIKDVIAIATQRGNDRRADEGIGSGNKDRGLSIHLHAAANFRSRRCVAISWMCASVSAPNRRSTYDKYDGCVK
jgi:hypothetical protein